MLADSDYPRDLEVALRYGRLLQPHEYLPGLRAVREARYDYPTEDADPPKYLRGVTNSLRMLADHFAEEGDPREELLRREADHWDSGELYAEMLSRVTGHSGENFGTWATTHRNPIPLPDGSELDADILLHHPTLSPAVRLRWLADSQEPGRGHHRVETHLTLPEAEDLFARLAPEHVGRLHEGLRLAREAHATGIDIARF